MFDLIVERILKPFELNMDDMGAFVLYLSQPIMLKELFKPFNIISLLQSGSAIIIEWLRLIRIETDGDVSVALRLYRSHTLFEFCELELFDTADFFSYMVGPLSRDACVFCRFLACNVLT